MKYTRLRLDIDERIATITFDDPANLNAMSLAMREECIDALTRIDNEQSADCVILTGAGPKSFSAGADIRELAERTVQSELSTSARVRRALPRLLETMRLPSLACVNGYCLGAGLEVALACTLRIAADTAKLGLPEIKLGVLPGSGGTQRLARMVGLGRAMELVTLGEPIGAEEAWRIGLVNSIHPAAELTAAARAICRKWQARGAFSLAAARDAVLKSCDVDLETGLDFETRMFALCLASGERDEGVQAFLGKREAKFRNR